MPLVQGSKLKGTHTLFQFPERTCASSREILDR
jgi:hypothetical protein